MTGYARITAVAGAAVLGLAVALGAGPALAEKGGNGKGHGNPHDGGHGGGHNGALWADSQDHGGGAPVVITTNDRTVIQNYFIAHPVGVSSLPPGIAKKVAQGRPLPPGIAKKQVPYALVQQVPACRDGWECILLGADMLILDAVHGVVRDIVRNVVR